MAEDRADGLCHASMVGEHDGGTSRRLCHLFSLILNISCVTLGCSVLPQHERSCDHQSFPTTISSTDRHDLLRGTAPPCLQSPAETCTNGTNRLLRSVRLELRVLHQQADVDEASTDHFHLLVVRSSSKLQSSTYAQWR